MSIPIKVKQAAITGIDSMQVVLEDKIPEEYLDKNSYEYIRQIDNYLYEVCYTTENIDYEYANNYFKALPKNSIAQGSCTGVVSNSRVLRQLDWTFDEGAEFIVRTYAERDNSNNIIKHASIGVASSITGLTKDIVQTGEYNRKFNMVPFIMADGINDAGLFVQSNVVTGLNFDLNPTATDECCITMVCRYILDNCASFADVEQFFNTYHIYNTSALKYNYHFLIAQGNDWRIIEITPTGHNTVGPNTSSCAFKMPYGVMTNFRATGKNNAGLEFTNNELSWSSVEDYGIGVERFDIGASAFIANKTLEELRSLLMYTKTYTGYNGANPWRTEFTEESAERTVMDALNNPEKFNQVLSNEHAHYLNRDRHEGANSVWQTTHSCIYDLNKKEFNIVIQENESIEYLFSLIDSAPSKQDKFPEVPNENGIYTLKCTVMNGTKVYSWIKD